MAAPRKDSSEPVYCLRILGNADVPVRRFYLEAGRTYVVGSASDAEIRLPTSGVSRRHACLEVLDDGGGVIEDLGSRNGTWVGERRVQRAALAGTERLSFGSLTAELIVLDPTLAGIAIASAGRVADARAAFHPPPAGGTAGPPVPDRTNPSTIGLSLEERLTRSLGPLLRRHSAGGVAVAQELVVAMLAELPIERMEIVHDGREGAVVAAAGGSEVERPADSEATLGSWRICFWGPIAPRTAQLRPILELALEMLSVDGAEPVAATPEAGVTEHVAPPAPASLAPAMRRLYRRVAKVARGQVPILIHGESGSGKEVLASFIHRASPRRDEPFLALNCAALPRELLEAELFGIERGVATGVDARRGLLQQASGGTLFLDEIGDMAPETQAKVLRALGERKVYRVGGRAGVGVDVRFVAATHRNLEQRIEEGSFRQDLYHRLAAHVARIPPLRERREDVALLAGHFFVRELERAGVASPGLTRGALGALCEYAWPGNVRELILEIAQAVLLLDPGEPLGLEHLSERVRSALDLDAPPPLTLDAHLRRAERQAISAALAASGGDAARAIDQLGVSRSTFYRKLKELGLETGD
ncbi:MAG: FHA domain-containing protein [bacterium]|nr:FHA domain-containing protein [bacterium]